MSISPRLQVAMLAFLMAFVAPGAVVSTDGIVHETVNRLSNIISDTTQNSTSAPVQIDMDKAVDRLIDRILR
jgi:hypothetical protein